MVLILLTKIQPGVAKPQVGEIERAKISLTDITAHIREHLMGNSHLLELFSLDRKTLAKPPDWNAPRQLELFLEFWV